MTWRHEAHAMLDEWFASREESRRYNTAMAVIRAERYRRSESGRQSESRCPHTLADGYGVVLRVGRT